MVYSRSIRAVVAPVAATLLALGVAACSLLIQSGRCATNADCFGRSANAVCSEGACVSDGPPTTDAPSTGPESGVAGECKTNAECAARLGEYAICEKSRLACVKLLSVDCTKVHGAYENDQALYVGTMFKQGDTAGDPGASPDAIAAIELAFDEFKNARGGVPDPAGGSSRPLVAVECNQTQDAVRAARHLAENIRVPAIIGASSSYVTIQVATQVTIGTGTFLISPYASSPGLTTLDDKGLVWRTYPSDSVQAAAVPKLVDELTASPGFTTPRAAQTAVRIGIVFKEDTYGEGLRDIILSKLRFNGKSAKENQDTGALKLLSYPNTDDPINANYDFTKIATQVVSEATPFDVLILLGTSEVISVFSYAESHWPSSVLPYYVMPDSVASTPKLSIAIDNIVTGGTTDSKSLRKRIRGTIVNGFNGPVFDAFSLRFSGNAINGANAYDAAYAVAYGAYALGTESVTGANLSTAMARIAGPGTEVAVGSENIPAALQGLAAGNIALRGTAGRLDFDLASGDVKATGAAVWCLGVDVNGKARLVTETGQTYSVGDDKLTGTFPDTTSGPDPCNFR